MNPFAHDSAVDMRLYIVLYCYILFYIIESEDCNSSLHETVPAEAIMDLG